MKFNLSRCCQLFLIIIILVSHTPLSIANVSDNLTKAVKGADTFGGSQSSQASTDAMSASSSGLDSAANTGNSAANSATNTGSSAANSAANTGSSAANSAANTGKSTFKKSGLSGYGNKREASTQTGLSAAAQEGLSLNPTPGDFSIVFLGNIFGVVDGVLAGSGSQIIGNLFGIFNSAVLAFGGIILLYSLIVSTTNTAHEGQVLGQKWSSIWLPLRSFVGVGTILPLASGYCVMQVFVMWLVVQGVGAADSVWSATLNYLNRGGAIIQKQLDPSTSANADDGRIMNGAMGILTAQTCMNALQIKYKKLYEAEVSKTSNISNCNISKDNVNSDWYGFCKTPVPNFVDSVDIMSDANTATMLAGNNITQLMPNFTSDSPYYNLNGICGQLSWDTYKMANQDDSLSHNDQSLILYSRALAITQMYSALAPVAAQIIENSPMFNEEVNCTNTSCVSDYAKTYYGEPLTLDYQLKCSSRESFDSNTACVNWGDIQQRMVIFNGRELQDAVAAYNGVMLPTINANKLNDAYEQKTFRLNGGSKYHEKGPRKEYRKHREFIDEAKSKGWIMAGAYFFRLAVLNNYMNSETGSGGGTTDTGSNLAYMSTIPDTKWSYSVVTAKLNPLDPISTNCTISMPLCHLPSQDFIDIGILLAGVDYSQATLPTSETVNSTQLPWFTASSNNLYTYLVNANSMVLPNQTTTLNAGFNEDSGLGFNPKVDAPKLPPSKINGGMWGVPGAIMDILANKLLIPVYNAILGVMTPLVIEIILMVLSPMMSMVGTIFFKALNVMRMEGVNPIISIAIMGTQFIDGIGNAWLAIAMYTAIPSSFPLGAAMMSALMPLVTVWLGIMLGVGFFAAFYVPFVPFLVFSFAGIGWLISVIESMIAAPIVALGIIMPEGHDTFGKSEQAFTLLLNVFLRPSLMILGYIFAIILSYVGIWLMNSGFNYALKDLMLLPTIDNGNMGRNLVTNRQFAHYDFWSGLFLTYFAVLTYVSTYMAIVQQSFELIHYLPDKVLRWISGGQAEMFGEGTVRSMLQDVESQSNSAAKQASAAMSKTTEGLTDAAVKQVTQDQDQQPDKKQDGEEGESEAGGGDSGGGMAGGS